MVPAHRAPPLKHIASSRTPDTVPLVTVVDSQGTHFLFLTKSWWLVCLKSMTPFSLRRSQCLGFRDPLRTPAARTLSPH